MTTDERIAELEKLADDARNNALEWGREDPIDSSWFQAWAQLAQVYELRALRLMLRDEIREAAWRLAAPGMREVRKSTRGVEVPEAEVAAVEDALASRKAPPPEPKVRLEDRP